MYAKPSVKGMGRLKNDVETITLIKERQRLNIVRCFYPFSLSELAADTSQREENRLLENRLIYGLYPEVVTPENFWSFVR